MEKQHEATCEVCKGNRLYCVRNPAKCPIFLRAKKLVDIEKMVDRTSFYGASPPAVFLGSYGYPQIMTGPLVPVIAESKPEILDSPDLWLDLPMDQLIGYRMSLVRGKISMKVQNAKNPSKLLSTMQEIALSNKATDTELLLKKKPHLSLNVLPRSPPHGPSGTIEKMSLTSNPSVPKPVDRIVYDTDLPATNGAFTLYQNGIAQQQITRMFSIGLLGTSRTRKLVPTEWSITAIDDILARNLRHKIFTYPQIDQFQIYGAKGHGNNVQILLLPSAWMFEALEGWLLNSQPEVYSDYELTKGRRDYPSNIAGAYHATRLPVMEHLDRVRRHAGAIVFLEVTKEWVPLGVWRFRELARRAFQGPIVEKETFDMALFEILKRLQIPREYWLRASRITTHFKKQSSLDVYA
jgi:hypothetical protein